MRFSSFSEKSDRTNSQVQGLHPGVFLEMLPEISPEIFSSRITPRNALEACYQLDGFSREEGHICPTGHP